MSFFDDASLVTIPSGIKDGVVYSVKPIDGSGDLTFSRGSDIEATRVNANGYIEKAQVNLVLQSNSFNTTWLNILTTSTSGQTGYDGTNDAWLLDSTGGFIQQNISLSGLYTYSVYAKKGTADGIRLRINAASDANCYINLNDGTEILSNSGVALSVISVGSGWYRIGLAINDSAIADVRFYPVDLSGINTTGNIYIQDAQLNYGLVAQTYQETTTAAVVSGITDNMPRLNYDPANPTCPSLLLEPSRQNYVTHSDFIGASDWDKTGGSVTVTTNATTSPEGVVNASKLTGVGTSVTYVLTRQTITLPAADNYTMSAYFKYSNNDWIYLTFSAYDGGGGAFFNINSGTVGTVASGCSASIQECRDGWYRCSVTAPIGASDLTGRPSVYVAYADGTTDFPSVGAAQNQAAFIYGVCVERGGYVSSLIPTYGSSATRTADACSKTGISSLIGQTEGTLFAEFDFEKLITGNTGRILCVGDNTSNNRIGMGIGGNGKFEGFVVSAGSLVAYFQTTNAITELKKYKMALSYKLNDFAFYINGVQIGTDNAGSVPTGMDKVFVGLSEIGGTGSQPSNGINQALLFKTRLSNADLATLTTL